MALTKEAILSLRIEGFAEAEQAGQRIAAYLMAAGQNAQALGAAMGGLGASVDRVAAQVRQNLGSALAEVPREISIAVTETRVLTSEIERAETRAGGLSRELRSGGRLAALLFGAAGLSGGGILSDTLGGAATGATFGSFFGPVGTAVGGVLGGVGGLAKGWDAEAKKERSAEGKQERAEDAELRREQRENSQAIRELTRSLERADRAANRVQIQGRGQFSERQVSLEDLYPLGPTR